MSTSVAKCQAKDPSNCRYHSAVSGTLSLQETIANNMAAREQEKKDVFKQEWLERSKDWKNYDFQHPISIRKSEHSSFYNFQSAEDTAHLTEEDIKALKFFSSNNYKWVNEFLYEGGNQLPTGNGSERTFHDYNIKSMSSQEVEENPTQLQAEAIISSLDSILSSEAQEPRVLYRGQSRKGKVLQGKSAEQIHSYVDANYQVGSEIKMQGYLSASPSAQAALGYSTSEDGSGIQQEGIFFELSTKKGLNITSVSLYSREAETLLPRDTKWKVVAVHKSKLIKTEVANKTSHGIKKSAKATIIQLVEID